MIKILFNRLCFWGLLLLLFGSAGEVMAQNIRIVGTVVTNDKHQTPIPGVMLVDLRNKEILTETDANGNFRVNCDPDAKIRFQAIGVKTKTIRVNAKTEFKIALDTYDQILHEVVIQNENNLKDTIRIVPGDVVQMGDKFHIRAVMKIGQDMLKSNKRLVAQAILYNFNRKDAVLMPPLVIDGKNYDLTQQRMYDCLAKDKDLSDSDEPIGKYARPLDKNNIGGKGKQRYYNIVYKDSVTAHVGKADFIRCDIAYSIEDYTKVCAYVKQNYVEGIINPLRFLEIPLSGSIVTDSIFYPRQELQMCASKGQIELNFAIGKSDLDMNNSQNFAEITKMQQRFNEIVHSPGASIKAFKITGTASPDGTYEFNQKLAEARMNSAKNKILAMLPDEIRAGLYSATTAEVAPWSNIVDMLRADSLNAEADALAEVIQKYPTHNEQSRIIRTLPFYQTLLQNKYLPRLRKVEYAITYDIRRALNIEEIKKLYQQSRNNLSKYEYFRLFRAAETPEEKEKICRDALEVHPRFWMAANDLQALLINRNASDDELLLPYIKRSAHPSLLTNHIVSLINANRYTAADTVSTYLSPSPDNRLLLATVGIYNNRVMDNYSIIEQTSPRNKVLVRLYMNRNQEAFDACNELDDNDAFTHYLKATCYKRQQDEISAIKELRTAFEMDPKLEEYAKVDGDLRKIYKKIKNLK